MHGALMTRVNPLNTSMVNPHARGTTRALLEARFTNVNKYILQPPVFLNCVQSVLVTSELRFPGLPGVYVIYNNMFSKPALHFGHFRMRDSALPFITKCFRSSKSVVNNLKIVSEDDAFSVSEPLIESVLKDHDVQSRKGFTCFELDCKLCPNKKKSNFGKIYVNRTTGYFQCEQCYVEGPWSTLRNVINEVKQKKKPLSDLELQELKFYKPCSKVPEFVSWNTMQSIHELPSDEIANLLSSFNLPMISSQALNQMDVHIDGTKSTLLFPLKTYHERTGYKILESGSGEEATIPPSGASGLIIFRPEDMVKRSNRRRTSAIIVTSVADAFALISSNISEFHIVCLPNGVSHLPQEILPALESYTKLILWLGNAGGAWEVAHVFAKKLNEKRCYLVRPTSRGPCPRDAAQGGEDLGSIIAEAKPAWVEAITTFSSLREQVLFEMQNIQKIDGVQWTRFPMLNNLLKGHRRGELTILTGPTGSGKTTFLSEYTIDLAQKGVNTLWGSFEIPNHRLARTMLTQLAQLPIHNHMEFFDEFADQLDALPIYFLKFHGQQSSKVVMKVVEHATYVHDIAHVVIDTVQFMLGTSEERNSFDRYWIQDLLIASFRSFATASNCHVTLVIHPRKEREGEDLNLNSVFGGAKATQEADTVLIIQDQRNSGGGMRLKVAKNRYCGILGSMPLEFQRSTLSFSSTRKNQQNVKDDEINKVAKQAGWRTF